MSGTAEPIPVRHLVAVSATTLVAFAVGLYVGKPGDRPWVGAYLGGVMAFCGLLMLLARRWVIMVVWTVCVLGTLGVMMVMVAKRPPEAAELWPLTVVVMWFGWTVLLLLVDVTLRRTGSARASRSVRPGSAHNRSVD